jgi:hypothetical protein
MKRIVIVTLVMLNFSIGSTRALAYDDAELLSARVPGQRYNAFEEFSALRHGEMTWFIRLWACDASSFEITKALGSTAPAAYAVKITPKGNNRIETLYPSFRRLYTIHLLAVSLEDAIKIRRALIREVDIEQRNIEKRQGNTPGHLRRVVSSWKS